MSYKCRMTPIGYISGHLHLRCAEDIAALIKSRREAQGLSQQALADRLTVSRKWVNEIEQGNSNAKLGLVLRALNELGVSLIAESSEAKQDAAHTAHTEDEIDIDAIADTGLRTTRPKPPAKRSKR